MNSETSPPEKYNSSGSKVQESLSSSTVTTSKTSFGDGLIQNLNAIVLEYLESSGLEESYRTFYRECKDKGIALPSDISETTFRDCKFSKVDGEQLLTFFDEEEGMQLLKMWKQLLDDMGPVENQAVKEITFYLEIYVAVIPYRQNLSDKEKAKSMASLREFFDQKPNELQGNANMLSLFALPYVSDPMNHPIFKHIFQDTWLEKLRSQIISIVEHHFQNRNRINHSPSSCDLSQMYMNWVGQVGSEPETTKCFLNKSNQTEKLELDIKNSELETKEMLRKQTAETEAMRKEVQMAKDKYFKLIQVTSEVVNSLERAVQGKAQDIGDLANKLQDVFPALFSSDIDGESQTADPLNKKTDSNNNAGANISGYKPGITAPTRPTVKVRNIQTEQESTNDTTVSNKPIKKSLPLNNSNKDEKGLTDSKQETVCTNMRKASSSSANKNNPPCLKGKRDLSERDERSRSPGIRNNRKPQIVQMEKLTKDPTLDYYNFESDSSHSSLDKFFVDSSKSHLKPRESPQVSSRNPSNPPLVFDARRKADLKTETNKLFKPNESKMNSANNSPLISSREKHFSNPTFNPPIARQRKSKTNLRNDCEITSMAGELDHKHMLSCGQSNLKKRDSNVISPRAGGNNVIRAQKEFEIKNVSGLTPMRERDKGPLRSDRSYKSIDSKRDGQDPFSPKPKVPR